MHGALYEFTQRAQPWHFLFAKYQIKSNQELTIFYHNARHNGTTKVDTLSLNKGRCSWKSNRLRSLDTARLDLNILFRFILLYFYTYFYFVCVNVWSTCKFSTCVPGLTEYRRGHQISWTWSNRWLWAIMWMLGKERWSSARPGSACNYWVISPTHHPTI